jgi:hypothetical protein
MSLTRNVVLIGALMGISPSASLAQAPVGRSPLEGTWNYVAPRHGQAIYQGNNYIMFNARPDSAAKADPPSEADYARLYRSLSLRSGTFSIVDSIVTMNDIYSKNPRQGPVTWRWMYSIKGDSLTWRVINAQGQVTATGVLLRAR